MKAPVVLVVLGAATLALAVWQWDMALSGFTAWLALHPVAGALAYVTLLAASVVLMPFSSLPLLPLASSVFGVALTALLSALGWWLGCLVAFQLARRGRHLLERFTSLAAIDRLEARVPADVGFGAIVLLRMVLPVDLVSFALGLLKQLPFSRYALASLLGILPFAFVWSYAGGELGAGNFLSFAAALGAMAAFALVLRHQWLKLRNGD